MGLREQLGCFAKFGCAKHDENNPKTDPPICVDSTRGINARDAAWLTQPTSNPLVVDLFQRLDVVYPS